MRITPYVRLTYQYVGQAAYDEGASASALNVSRMNANGVRAVIGVGENAYAYAGVSGEARTGQTLYGGSVGLRMAF